MKEGWEYKKLSLVCSKITDGSHFSPKVDDNGIYPMLSVKDMMANCFNYTTCKYINENDYNILVANGCKPKVNDVLVAKDGSYLKTAFVLKEDKEQALLSSIAIITPRLDEIVPEYLAFYFKAPHTKSVVEKHYLTGTAIKRVILKGFKNITIPVPPLSEQQHIVEELDLLSSIIEKKKAQLNELDNLAQSLFYEMFGDPITNEKGWEVKKIGEIAESKIGITYKPTDVNDEGVIVLRSSNIQNSEIDLEDIVRVNCNIKDEKYVRNGDILMCTRNGSFRLVGKVAMINNLPERMTYGAFMTIIRSQYNDFLFMFFQLPAFRQQLATAQTATINQITVKMLNDVKVIVPPLSLQQEYASKIEAIEHQKELIKQSIKEVETLFNSRMDYYFN